MNFMFLKRKFLVEFYMRECWWHAGLVYWKCIIDHFLLMFFTVEYSIFNCLTKKVLFLVVESADFSNKYIRSVLGWESQSYGFITIDSKI